MMSSFCLLSALLAVLAMFGSTFALDEDFAFDLSDDLEADISLDTPKKVWGTTEITAHVGRLFYLAVPKDTFGDSVKLYEAKADYNKPLPSWLLFDKTGGVFWGVPLQEDVGVLHISVRAVRQANADVTDDFTLRIDEDKVSKCPSDGDNTVLTLIIDKAVKAIKPKQRIISINNIAKFLGIPYDDFIMEPETHPDDINDSSVILAGPGNLKTRTSKSTTFIQVGVGCEGRLWLNTAPTVHQLKEQARDGTISEVMRLPLIGWRVTTESPSIVRQKRHDDGYVGSGDYEEYYEYDDYDDPDKEPDESSTVTPITTKARTIATTVTHQSSSTHEQPLTTTVTSETHPHRHHHGEARPIDQERADEEDLEKALTEVFVPTEQEEAEVYIPQEPTSSQTIVTQSHTPTTATSITTNLLTITTTTTSTTTPSTTTTTSTTKMGSSKPEIVTSVSGLYKPSETLDGDDEYDDYDDEEDDDDDEESVTEIPIYKNVPLVTENEKGSDLPDIITDTETTPVEIITLQSKTDYTESDMITTVPMLNTTTEDTKTSVIVTEEIVPITTTTESSTPTFAFSTSSTTEKVTTIEELTTVKHTTLRHALSSTTATTQKPTTPLVTESIMYEVKNFPPTTQIRFNRIVVTAGKHFSEIVPIDMFSDIEDGTNLKLEFLDKDKNAVNRSSWCQFNSERREIYGIPLEEDVSRWEFYLRATDREGASVKELVEIVVQQHKYWRVVNHEFTLFARVEKKQEFLYPLDWAVHILRGIGTVLHTSNMSKITVRNVNYTTDPVIFTWTNDSLPTNYCPKSEIEQLYDLLTANDDGDPSIALNHNLAPALRAKKVTLHKMGICEELEVPQPPASPLPPTTLPHAPSILPPSPINPPSNLAPILRNAVDHLKATVGELFLYTVPSDTFYDPEDVDPRNLKIHLYTVDRQPIPPDHWLQFDTKNREFFGIPSSKDPRRSEYQLVCEDNGGLTASDTLVVEILPAPKRNYNVEFSMTIEVEHNTFASSATLKRKFIDKLLDLFEDINVNNIHLSTISRGSSLNKDTTIITWYNNSLAKDDCPWNEIKDLKSLLVNSEKIIANRVHKAMGEEFVVAAFRLEHLGNCKKITSTTIIPKIPDPAPIPIDEGTAEESHDEYLITFIVPAVIICIMLLLAGIGACVLYRRRRSGKLNVEEDARQIYGNKGVPVILQEEFDEKPEPGTKAPVILKDEKPPLAPPEYSKSGSLKLNTDDSEPYQPPPPFTRTQDNGRQARPKPTPTYRKPPPYVPP